jgi:hypothetical protein
VGGAAQHEEGPVRPDFGEVHLERAVHVDRGVHPRVVDDRDRGGSPADRMADDGDVARVDLRRVPPEPAVGQLVQDEADVDGTPPRDPGAELRGVLALAEQAAGDAAVEELHGTRLVGVVDAGHDVTAGGEVLGQRGQRLAAETRPGRQHHERPAAGQRAGAVGGVRVDGRQDVGREGYPGGRDDRRGDGLRRVGGGPAVRHRRVPEGHHELAAFLRPPRVGASLVDEVDRGEADGQRPARLGQGERRHVVGRRRHHRYRAGRRHSGTGHERRGDEN